MLIGEELEVNDRLVPVAHADGFDGAYSVITCAFIYTVVKGFVDFGISCFADVNLIAEDDVAVTGHICFYAHIGYQIFIHASCGEFGADMISDRGKLFCSQSIFLNLAFDVKIIASVFIP